VVCDFPSFTQRGEEFAKEQLADALSFTTNRQDANGSLVYLTNGTLQYIETGLAEMLSELAEKPPHVLVNRVPVYSGETYYTVQYGAFSYSPYKVMNAEQLINSMEHLGYRKIDQWSLPRKLRIPFRSAHFVADYQGFYFALSPALPL
jgi:putative methyltransferase (TIGR04325 family)